MTFIADVLSNIRSEINKAEVLQRIGNKLRLIGAEYIEVH
jgi:hypothetical protein